MNIFSIKTIGVTAVALAAVVGIGVFAPRLTGTAKAETCTNAPSVPTFNIYPLTFDPNNRECKDFPLLRLRQVNGNYAHSAEEARAGIEAHAGDELFATLYVHNGAASNLDRNLTTAKNVHIRSRVSNETGSTHEVEVEVVADNAQGVVQSYSVKTASNERLEIVPNSGEQYDSESNLLQAGFAMGNNEVAVGDQKSCFEFAYFYRFRFRVVSDTTQNKNATLAITKEVRNLTTNSTFSGSTDATRGDQIEYRVKVRNTSNTNALGVFMGDNLDNTGIDISGQPSVTVNFSGNLSSGLNLGTLTPNQEVIITYRANVNRESITVTNIAVAYASNASRVEARAIVNVNVPSKGNMVINKQVRSVSQNGSFSNSTNANSNDRVEYQIRVSVNSGRVQNIVLNDQLPTNNFALISGSVRLDGNYVSDNSASNISLGTLSQGQSKTLVFQGTVTAFNNTNQTTITNRACATADNVDQVCDNATVYINQVNQGQPNLVLSKRAFNDTKNQDATTVNASREDYITYTLTVTNTGSVASNNFVITDDLSGVLTFSDLTDNGGGTLSGQTISYPAVSVPANGSVSKSFKVRVKYNLPANLSFVMVNTYGNTVRVTIVGPQVTGPIVAPKTGVDGMTAASFGGIITAAAALAIKRKTILSFILNK